MGRDRAAYMRGYRAKRRTLLMAMESDAVQTSREATDALLDAMRRIAELEGEVARLKRKLAAAASAILFYESELGPTEAERRGGGFNTQPFTPVPKSGSRR